MRFFSIIKILITYRFDKLLPKSWWTIILRFFLLFIPYSYSKKAKLSRGEKITHALEDAGVIFIKFGQVLSTRRDLLPQDIAEELVKLQDNCRPFANDEAIAIIEESLTKNIHQVFDNFSTQPLASASIAQVYTATLKENQAEVVIKVVRPGIDKQIKRDLKLMYFLAKFINLHPQLKRLRPIEVVNEFKDIITLELNMKAEAINAQLLKNNFDNSDLLYVPTIYDKYSTKNILVLERIYGTTIGDIATLKDKNINLKILAENGVKIFFTQVFEHNFFHADMHPGNIFVSDDGIYQGVDFGIMCSLSEEDKHITANLFSAFFNQDYQKIARIFIDSGWIGDINIVAFENAIRIICQPMFAKSLGDISFGEVLLNLFKEAKRFDAYIQPQLLLFDKTLLSVEGLGRQLYPELDLWKTAKPLLDKIMRNKYNINSKLKKLRHNLPLIADDLEQFPYLAIGALKQLQNLNSNKDKQNQRLINQLKDNNKKQNKFLWLLLALLLLTILQT